MLGKYFGHAETAFDARIPIVLVGNTASIVSAREGVLKPKGKFYCSCLNEEGDIGAVPGVQASKGSLS